MRLRHHHQIDPEQSNFVKPFSRVRVVNNTLSITQSAIIAAVTQIVALVVGFGIVDSTVAGEIVAASTAVVNAAFILGNALHVLAAAKSPK